MGKVFSSLRDKFGLKTGRGPVPGAGQPGSPLPGGNGGSQQNTGGKGAGADQGLGGQPQGGAPSPFGGRAGMGGMGGGQQPGGLAPPKFPAGSYLQFSTTPTEQSSGRAGPGQASAGAQSGLGTGNDYGVNWGSGNTSGWAASGLGSNRGQFERNLGGEEWASAQDSDRWEQTRDQAQNILDAAGRGDSAGIVNSAFDYGESTGTPGPWDGSGGGGEESGLSDEEQAYINEYLKNAFDEGSFKSVEDELNAQRDAALRAAYEGGAARGMQDSGAMGNIQSDIFRNTGRDIANAQMDFKQKQIDNMANAASMLYGDKWRSLDREQQRQMADIMLDHQIEFQEAMRRMQEGDPGPIESFFNDIANLFS